ncbi:hypothetical protein BIV57_13375 [Mangrovactinospora gilvigrisea]|uniref:Uncharacterized protein n=1 Tax=Mangrovactinospora gilvigrisea TaxID=1428644 RepID=A0A1J7C5Z9_9ACTN|nr:hypothetical protein [Mangrovactinospora gilvigrisea]OIV36976.1 hypothetical protein BIV57_13375 [Mangrovactinospora gilvigrisea]
MNALLLIAWTALKGRAQLARDTAREKGAISTELAIVVATLVVIAGIVAGILVAKARAKADAIP